MDGDIDKEAGPFRHPAFHREQPRTPEPWEEIDFDRASFRKAKAIVDLADRGVGVPPEYRTAARDRMGQLVTQADQEGVFDKEVKRPFLGRLRGTDWDTLQEELWSLGDNLNTSILNRGYSRELDGVVPYVMEGAYAKLVLLGIDHVGVDDEHKDESRRDDSEWLGKHGYSSEIIRELEDEAQEKYGGILVRAGSEKMVGAEQRKREEERRRYEGEDPRAREFQESMAEQRRQHDQLMNSLLQQVTQQQPQTPFTPEQFARMMGQGTPEEQRELYLRAEEVMYPIPLQLQVPNFLLSPDPALRAKEQREWRARGALTSMAAIKKSAPSYDKQFANQEAIDFTGEYLVDLFKMKGVMEMISSYVYLISRDRDISMLGIPDPSYDPAKEEGPDNSRYLSSVFQIKTGGQFLAFRKGMSNFIRQWMSNGGRNITDSEARDAEHVAWNLAYSANVIEEFDSRFENGREKRIPPTVSQFKALSMWMMMHPQERLEGKTADPKIAIEREDEEWVPEAMGSLGEWAVNRAKVTKRRLGVDPDTIVLPKTMFTNTLRRIEPRINGTKVSLFEILQRNGEYIFDGTGRWISTNNIDWSEIETPFSNDQFSVLSPAIKVFDVIAKGEADSLTILANSMRKMNNVVEMPRQIRENLLMALDGVKPNEVKLTPARGWVKWRMYKNQLKKNAPNFFL